MDPAGGGQVTSAAAAQGAFSVRAFCAVCGPAGQFWLKLGNTTHLDECKRLLWNNYADFLKTQIEYYPPLSPNVSDHDLVLALPDGRPIDGAPPLRPHEPLKNQLPRPCFLALVIGAAWLNRDALIRREAATRHTIEVEQDNMLCVVQRVGIMHRMRQESWREERERAEAVTAEFERRAVAELLRAQRERETENRQRGDLNIKRQEYSEELNKLGNLVAEYDSRKRQLLAMSGVLLPTQRLVEESRVKAGARAEKLRREAEDARQDLWGRTQLFSGSPQQMGGYLAEDLLRESDERAARAVAIDAMAKKLKSDRKRSVMNTPSATSGPASKA
eukprot:Hpha_TRINITY_DN2020_c0_g1::TRINITY_DN2020_c0_g1_i1::g.83062::m.83062